jgi:sirohydrochlorin ferrochelatase
MTSGLSPLPALDDKSAILLIAHGSRRPAANADLVQIADWLKAAGHGGPIACGYLELAEPDIPTAARSCLVPGIERLLMLPYFLSAGVHVTADLEEIRQSLVTEFPGVEFVLCPHLGLHPLMLEIVKDRLREGVAQVMSSPVISITTEAVTQP